jgi:hypothetical protein
MDRKPPAIEVGGRASGDDWAARAARGREVLLWLNQFLSSAWVQSVRRSGPFAAVPQGTRQRLRRAAVTLVAAAHALPASDVRVDLLLAEVLARAVVYCGPDAAEALLSGGTLTPREVRRLARVDVDELHAELARRTGRAPGNGARKRRA